MTPGQLAHAFAELELARRRRELLFWTLRNWLGIAVLGGLTVAALVMLVHGETGQAQVLAGAGVLGAGGGALLARRS